MIEVSTGRALQRAAENACRVLAAACVLLLAPCASAQVVLDGTLGQAGALTGPNYAITAGVGRQAGTNLFHSFGQFNINTGQSATFSGPAAIQNIIGRVTGGSASNINGLLQSTISGAHLYFINPAGIVFGPNAQLNVTGSFHASTAGYLKLGPGGRFDALSPAASVLTSAPPSAFGFAAAPAGAITLDNAVLQVPNGKGLALIGGALTANDAVLVARGGRVDLASVASAGEISLAPQGTTASGVTAYSAVTLDHTLIATNSVAGHQPQGISIRGGALTLTNGSNLLAVTAEPGNASGVTLEAAGPLVMNRSAIAAETTGAGRGGGIAVRANGVTLEGGAFIESHTSGAGAGGDLLVESAGPMRISGATPGRTGIYSSTSGPGDAGALRVSAPSLALEDGGLIHSHAATGRGAAVTVETGNLTLSGGGRIESIVVGSGAGGNIRVSATGDVAISGTNNALSNPESGIVTEGLNGSTGRGGDLRLDARDVALSAEGLIATQTFDAFSGAIALGGDIALNVRRLSLASEGTIESAVFTGIRGGALSLRASDSVSVLEGGSIRSFSAVEGASGPISITTPILSVLGGSVESTAISSGATNGPITISADSVLITAGGRVQLRNQGGTGGDLTMNAAHEVRVAGTLGTQVTGAGRAGGLTLNTPLLVVDGDGLVATQATAVGGGSGDIVVRAGRIELGGDGRISATTFGGTGGVVDVMASEAILINTGPYLPGVSIGIAGIQSESFFSDGNAGTVRISAPLIAIDNGHISTTTTSGGAGGAIDITVGRLALTGDANISAISQLGGGRGGSVRINASESISIGPAGASVGAAIGTSVGPDSTGDAGSITIAAPRVRLQGRTIASTTAGAGRAGNIGLQSGRLDLLDDAAISTSTFSSGAGGSMNVTADDILIRSSVISSDTRGSGRAGTVTVNAANSLSIAGDGGITTDTVGRGAAGAVVVSAPLLVMTERATITSESETFLSGDAGSVNVSAGRIELSGGAVIGASTFGQGKGGSVSVAASESLDIQGTGRIGQFDTGVASATQGPGKAGEVSVRAPVINMRGGFIASTSAGGGDAGNVSVQAGQLNMSGVALIDASTLGAANGGNVSVQASESILITGAGARLVDVFNTGDPVLLDTAIQSASFGSGRAGSVAISAPALTLDGGQIRSSSTGIGNAGNIVLDGLQALKIVNGGEISTQAALADGGNIHITASDLVYLRDSRITTSVGADFGNGGNITIDPIFVVLDNSQIIANAIGGNGGNINIVSQFFLATPDSLVQASSTFGLQGTVTLTAPNVDLGAGLVALPGAFFDASLMMRESCAARSGHAANTFIGVGRGGLPVGPERFAFGAYSDGAVNAINTVNALAGADSVRAAAAMQQACLRGRG